MIRKNLQLLHLIERLANIAGSTGAITQRKQEARQRFILQDQTMVSVYTIKSGIAKCFITEENGKDYILEFLGEGEVLGEIEAIRGTRALCTVEALTPLVLFIMDTGQFLHFLRTLPEFNMAVLEMLATRVTHASIKSARQQLYTLSELAPQLLSALESQQIDFTKQDLSEYLGISVRSLNRLLKDPGKVG